MLSACSTGPELLGQAEGRAKLRGKGGRGPSLNEASAYWGPFALPDGVGYLTSARRDAIRRDTGVSCTVHRREQWGGRPGLTLSGPPAGLEEARDRVRAAHGWRRGAAQSAATFAAQAQTLHPKPETKP